MRRNGRSDICERGCGTDVRRLCKRELKVTGATSDILFDRRVYDESAQ